jgi:transketolase C-terminal domain/subunit
MPITLNSSDQEGPGYVRLGRSKLPPVMPAGYRFCIGKAYTYTIGRVIKFGVRDTFGCSGSPDELLKIYGLMAGDIAAVVEDNL